MTAKIFSLVVSVLVSSVALAVEAPIYQVVLNVKTAGKVVSSSSLIVAEGQKGDIKSITNASTGTAFEVTVSKGKSDKLSIDYRFTDRNKKQSIEIAKTAVEILSGASENSELKDSSGNDLALEITVTKRLSASAADANIKQKFALPEAQSN